MKRLFTIALLLLATASFAIAQQVERTESRPGVRVNYFSVFRSDAVATLVMFSGGNGGFGHPDPNTGWTDSNNFVIRTAPQFAAAGPFNIILMGRASDVDGLEYAERASPRHAQDNLAVLRDVKRHSPLPIWLVGTSRGTISATATTVADSEGLVSGLVLTSSVTDYRKPGSVNRQELSRVHVPTLVVHHLHDACKLTPSSGVPSIMLGLSSTNLKDSIIVSGGEDQAVGDVCSGQHNHGFHGIESQVVATISQWILKAKPSVK